MNTCLFNVFHDTANHYLFAVADGIDINFVETEVESELSIHKADPITGFTPWNQSDRMWGLVQAKALDDSNAYFRGVQEGADRDLVRYVIYHELAHIFGLSELENPTLYSGNETILGYNWDTGADFAGYTSSDVCEFKKLYGQIDPAGATMTNTNLLDVF